MRFCSRPKQVRANEPFVPIWDMSWKPARLLLDASKVIRIYGAVLYETVYGLYSCSAVEKIEEWSIGRICEIVTSQWIVATDAKRGIILPPRLHHQQSAQMSLRSLLSPISYSRLGMIKAEESKGDQRDDVAEDNGRMRKILLLLLLLSLLLLLLWIYSFMQWQLTWWIRWSWDL